MTRSVPVAIQSGLAQGRVAPWFAVEFDFDTAPLRLWSGHGTRAIGGEVYTGGGGLLSISGLDEVRELEAKNASLVLSGVKSEIIALALSEDVQGRACRILFGLEDVPDEYVVAFSGIVDTMPIEDDGEVATITVNVESKLATLDRPRIRRYTHESQQSLHPGDTFFSFVSDLQDKEVVWGRAINNA